MRYLIIGFICGVICSIGFIAALLYISTIWNNSPAPRWLRIVKWIWHRGKTDPTDTHKV